MSFEDLKEQDVLLPEEEWGTYKLQTTTSQLPVLLLFLCSVAGCIMMFMGNGNTLTWIGAVLFFITFFGIIILCDRAVLQQRKRMRKERKHTAEDDEGKND